MTQSIHRPGFGDPTKRAPMIWAVLLLIWFLVLCFVPDPRPLGAPKWAVHGMMSLVGLSEAGARAIATIGLRGTGIGLIGILLSLTLLRVRIPVAAPSVLVGSALLAIISMWINYGYFPIAMQVELALICAIIGSLIGLVLRRSAISLAILILFSAGVFLWGTSTGISDDLFEAARATGLHLLDNAEDIPDGDEGFAQLLKMAFAFAEDNSHGTECIDPNKAAILALGVILGEERVANVAGRGINIDHRPAIKKLYQRVSIRKRNDLARHFWVSAALTILAGESRSMDVGITKELMDATAGGSGFSFVDLMADRAGTLFATVATRNNRSALNLQIRIRQGVETGEYFPEVEGLPEGISRDDFQNQYGGLGGTETNRIVDEIRSRLDSCSLLKSVN